MRKKSNKIMLFYRTFSLNEKIKGSILKLVIVQFNGKISSVLLMFHNRNIGC